jgi:hypothetical protein
MERKDPKFVGFERNLWDRAANRYHFGRPKMIFAADFEAGRRRKRFSTMLRPSGANGRIAEWGP